MKNCRRKSASSNIIYFLIQNHQLSIPDHSLGSSSFIP